MLEKLFELLYKVYRGIIFLIMIYFINRNQFDLFVLIFGALVLVEGGIKWYK